MPGTISLPRGTTAAFKVIGTKDGVNPATGFLGSDGLQCKVWPGRDQPAIFTPAATWLDPTNCTIQVAFTPGMTAAIEPETYEIELDVLPASSSDVIPIWRGFVEIQFGPGSAGMLRTPYCSAYHVRKWAPIDVDDLQRDDDLAGFLEFRVDATNWVDEIILNRYYPNLYFLDQKTAAQASFFGSVTYGQDPNLMNWLLQGKLLLRPKVIEIVARKTIGEIYRRALSKDNGKNGYCAAANMNLAWAEDAVKSLRAEVDLNGDGVGDLIIDCGVAFVTRQ